MNIVACDKPCLHQKDGYCTLEKVPYITSSKEKGCLYYVENSKEQPVNYQANVKD
ncbi:hydroxymyristoyl-ACP dehydratase [Zongyangia sp. HA2173]|uniref:hydroxymyristoyl-ACP dehydratase n=1 Tax=Zongyangia sp. HA2173 TaxID=3133035 RepID=UPI003166F873